MAGIPRRLIEIFKQFHVQIAYAFGSRAHELKECLGGNSRMDTISQSDIDIGIKVSEHLSFDVHNKVRLAVDIEDLLGVQRVDLVALNEADPFLAANIVRGERIFCEDQFLADEYELYVLRKAGDLAPFERRRIDGILAQHP